MKENEQLQFKKNFLNLRWLIVIAAGYMAVSSPENAFTAINYINSLVIIFIATNIILYYFPLELFFKKYFRYLIFMGDIILVTLGIYLTNNQNNDFFLLYFLVIVITALGKDLKASIISTIVASLLYIWIIFKKSVNIYDVNIYMRVPFLFVIGLFTGFLSETVNKEETQIKDLGLILAITNIMNENMNYKILVKLLNQLFMKINTILDWEIGIFNNNTGKFKLLREESVMSVSDLEPEAVNLLIKKGKIYEGRRYIYFPQTREKKFTGFLRVKPKNFKTFTGQDYDLFMTLASEFAIVIERNKLYEQIKNLANLDRLTELYNYGYFLEQADRKVAEKKNFAIIMIDLDHFKNYNDTYGHLAGNSYLKKIADNFKVELKTCVLARYGGDEFVVLREGKNKDIAAFLKKFKANMDAKFIKFEKKIKVSMSIGYALYPNHGKTAEEVLASADTHLYKAKQAGKNRVTYL